MTETARSANGAAAAAAAETEIRRTKEYRTERDLSDSATLVEDNSDVGTNLHRDCFRSDCNTDDNSNGIDDGEPAEKSIFFDRGFFTDDEIFNEDTKSSESNFGIDRDQNLDHLVVGSSAVDESPSITATVVMKTTTDTKIDGMIKERPREDGDSFNLNGCYKLLELVNDLASGLSPVEPIPCGIERSESWEFTSLTPSNVDSSRRRVNDKSVTTAAQLLSSSGSSSSSSSSLSSLTEFDDVVRFFRKTNCNRKTDLSFRRSFICTGNKHRLGSSLKKWNSIQDLISLDCNHHHHHHYGHQNSSIVTTATTTLADSKIVDVAGKQEIESSNLPSLDLSESSANSNTDLEERCLLSSVDKLETNDE